MYGTATVREILRAKEDPRAQLAAYVTDGTKLCEVMERKVDVLVVEDCKSGTRWHIPYLRVLEKWRLVRAAPAVPDTPEAV